MDPNILKHLEPDNEELLFDEASVPLIDHQHVWKILVVDDDADVHTATTLAFANKLILGRSIEFFHAYNSVQARKILTSVDQMAVILLDVVIEELDSGLKLVEEIRRNMQLMEVRVILRTGQPGYAPQLETVQNLDINDFRTKTELSRNRLLTAVISAVRSYDQISKLSASRRGLDLIVRGSAELMRLRGLGDFASGVIVQLSVLLGIPPEGFVCAQQSLDDCGEPALIVLAAAGKYAHQINQPIDQLGNERVTSSLLETLNNQVNQIAPGSSTLYIGNGSKEIGVYLETPTFPDHVDIKLIEVFCSSMSVCLENVHLFESASRRAYFDEMVQLPNRAALLRTVDQTLAASVHRNDVLALIDIDNFAEINDTLGHHYGDQLLQSIAIRLKAALANAKLVARVGGDVFGIFGDENAIDPEHIVSLFVKPFRIGGDKQTVTVTLGLARLSEIDGGADVAFKSASIALKRAQAVNRGHFSFFNRALGILTNDRVKLLRNLRTAFESSHLFLTYQPQISLETGQVVGCEALLRWKLENGNFVSPDAFIPLAERSGLILPIGEWVLRTACTQVRQLHQAGYEHLRMAINVSVVQFKSPGFLKTLDKALTETGVNPARIELEITESVAMLDSDYVTSLISQIKTRQVQIAVDDFGTGFSSLAYLHRLDIDRLKIDKSFITGLEHNQNEKSIAAMVIDLAKNLGIQVIAEGVETLAQAELLRGMQCDEAQGYYFGRPMEFENFRLWLQSDWDTAAPFDKPLKCALTPTHAAL